MRWGGERGRRIARVAARVAGPAAVGVIVALALQAAGAFTRLEQDTIDARYDVRGTQKAPSDVVLVALDDRSLDVLGERPPIPRTQHARLLDILAAAHPKVIAYDVQFTEPTTLRADTALYDAVSRARPVVLATTDVTPGGGTRVLGSTANVERAGGRVGIALYPLSSGGVYRRVTARANGLPTFPVVAARLAGARPDPGLLDGDGALIDYAGPEGTLTTYSFADVLRHRIPPSAFRGKVVVVGVSATSQQDLHPTPAPGGELMPGMEIQGNAIATLLRDIPLRDAGWLLRALVLAACALLAAAIGRRLAPPLALAGAGLLLAGLAVAGQLAFDGGTVLVLVTPAVALLVAAAAAVAEEQRLERRERARLQALLERLAPGEDPERVLERVAGRGPDALLRPGERFGPYRVGEPLGVGAMGVVYAAVHEELQRDTAIKLLAPALADDPTTRERLRREALSAARLDHPNVVAVHDAGTTAGRAFIAMQLVEGRALHDLIGTPQLDLARIGAVVGDVAAALDHAHERGVVHRDVKPQNVLVEDDGGRALLADFGIAAAAGQDRLTSLQDVVGTVAYAAPEQLSGATPAPGVDIYALGCVLYELLTGEVPFARPTLPAAIQAHLAADAPVPSERVPALAGTGIDEVVARALAKDPADRYASAGELAAAARAALARVPEGSLMPQRRRPPRASSGGEALDATLPGA